MKYTLWHISHETRSAILAAKYVSTIPGITADGFGDVIASIGDEALITVVVDDNVSLVSNLIFLTVLLFNVPLDDLIKFDNFVRCCWES